MESTKEEIMEVYNKLNRLIVKKEQYRSLHHLKCNTIYLKPNEPVYCKIFVSQKQAPLNIMVFKEKQTQNFNMFYSRSNPMPDNFNNDGKFQNVIILQLTMLQANKIQIQDRHELKFNLEFIYLAITTPQSTSLEVYVYFNKERPQLLKKQQDPLLPSTQNT